MPFLAGQPCFTLVALVGLTIGLAIGGVELMGGDIAIGLLGFFWWNLLRSFERCYIAKAGSQVFFSLG